MIGDKTLRYEGKNTDLNALGASIAQYLQQEGFKVQMPKPSENAILIQAQKGGFLRELITSERALNIMIEGQPNDFSVRVGIGKWFQNVAVAAVETIALSELFLPLDVAEMTWNLHVEDNVIRKIDELANSTPVLAH